MYLPLANILHHKLRSVLSAVGIGIGVCMLVTLTGLSRGSLYEVADRWESVDADLIVFPQGWGDNAATKSGVGLSEKYATVILNRHGDIVDRAIPVFTWPMKLGGQDQTVAGVEAKYWRSLAGGRELQEGRLFDPKGKFADWIQRQLLTRAADTDETEAFDIPAEALSDPAHDGLEIIIDSRLASAGNYKLNQVVHTANHDWRIVGIAPAGVMTRVFMPLRTAQYLFNSGDITKCTLIFLKLKPGVDVGPASRKISDDLHLDVVPLDSYRGMLKAKFGAMFVYVDAVNAVALTIAFLFVMTTLYTMVLQRTREIAILKSCGASNLYIIRQVVGESIILTAFGTVVGLSMSFAAAWAIHRFAPLLTVRISIAWVGVAVAAALAGAVISALYPAWRATRVDMVEALTYE